MRIFLAVGLVLVGLTGKSQSCSAPKPLTEAQAAMVKGDWTGYYELRGERIFFDVSIGLQEQKQFTLVLVPPLTGDPIEEENRFCGSGAFHFKKVVGVGLYEFDGVPVGDIMNGTVEVESAGEKHSGTFRLMRNNSKRRTSLE